MTTAGQWEELKPRLGPRIDGLVDFTPLLGDGSALVPDHGPLQVVGPGIPWSYLARFRLRAGVIGPSGWGSPLVFHITATALRGRVGAICVADDLQTVLGNSVEWVEGDGELTLPLVAYTYPGQGWLVFRCTAGSAPAIHLRVSAVDVFALHPDHPPSVSSAAACASRDCRAVIYTAITNNYDTLKPPHRVDPSCDYICFTDEPSAVPPPWKGVKIERMFRDSRMSAKWCKVHPHVLFPSHDVSIWMDGRVEVKQEILPLARAALSGTSFAVFDNPWYQCAYLDAESVTREGRDVPGIVEQQMRRYRQSGLPRHLGDLSPGVTFRRHQDAHVVRTMTAWWEELEGGSHRDTISLVYVLWAHRLPFRRIWLPVDDNSYFRLGEHNLVDYYRV